jgi:putative zinc finger/helix-turn-helix YgiT family protein
MTTITKCAECGAAMKSGIENYKYNESGLPYVTLEGVEVRRCPKCGEVEVVIPRIEELHRGIATTLIEKAERFAGAEVRFLRKYLGFSGADFAPVMGVTASTVSRWENDQEPIGPQADRLLRMMVATRPPLREYPLDNLARVTSEPKASKVRMRVSKGAWAATA